MDWCCAVEHSILYSDQRVELVIVLDENSEESLYHQWTNRNSGRFKIRILVNDVPTQSGWRPPCLAINAGIRHSRGIYCVVQSPESVALFPHVNYLFGVLERQERPFYLTGLLAGAAIRRLRDGASVQQLYNSAFATPIVGFGWLLFKRKDGLAIGGYDETRETYGLDDNCIRRRLQAHGCQHVNDPNIRVVHMDRETRPARIEPPAPMTTDTRLVMGPSAFRKAYDWVDG